MEGIEKVLAEILAKASTGTPNSSDPPEPERCGICNGAGLVKSSGSAIGSASGIVLCICQQQAAENAERTARLWRVSGLPAPAKRCRFDNYDATLSDNAKMLAAVRRFVEERVAYFRNEYTRDEPSPTPPWLAIFGHRGTGKTHLAFAAVQQFLAEGVQGVYWYMPDLLDRLRSGFDDRTHYAELERLKTTALLVLDDIGTEKESDWADELLDKLMDYRYRHELSTLITTNKSLGRPDEDKRGGVPLRTADRLRDVAICRRVQNKAPSYRPQNTRRT